MFSYAKNVRLVSFLQQAFQMALTGFLPVSLWLSMALCDSHSGSHWLSLPLSGKLWPSLAHYCSLISRIQPLIGSQGSALSAVATLTHYLPLYCKQYTNKNTNANTNTDCRSAANIVYNIQTQTQTKIQIPNCRS